jgi:putative IMPACT (imprinted ancient) family translation regulator
LLHIISQVEGQVVEQEYLQQVQFSLLIPEAKLTLVAQKLQTLSAGKLVLTNLKQ